MSGNAGVVIVGAGLSGAHAAIALRREGFEGPVTIVDAGTELPYDRTKVSKEYLQGAMTRVEIAVKPDAWWGENEVTMLLGTTATAIDREARTLAVRSADGAESDLPYEWLILATGARPRALDVPGATLPGVYTLRTVADADALRERIEAGGRLAIVGAGWIGLEVAASATQGGMSVTVAAPGAVPLERPLGAEVGGIFAQLHRAHGVDLRMGTKVEGILEREGRAAGLRTDHGDLEADAVVIAVGAQLELSLAEQAGLATDHGVVADARLTTSDARILAIGDIANADNELYGAMRREHWDTALRQGKLAARVITGKDGAYDWQPYFYTDQYDLGMEYVGNNDPGDEVVIRGEVGDGAGEYLVFWLRDGVVTAGMNVNIWDVNDELRALIGTRVAPERLRDASIALSELA